MINEYKYIPTKNFWIDLFFLYKIPFSKRPPLIIIMGGKSKSVRYSVNDKKRKRRFIRIKRRVLKNLLNNLIIFPNKRCIRKFSIQRNDLTRSYQFLKENTSQASKKMKYRQKDKDYLRRKIFYDNVY